MERDEKKREEGEIEGGIDGVQRDGRNEGGEMERWNSGERRGRRRWRRERGRGHTSVESFSNKEETPYIFHDTLWEYLCR